jgi:hypothetical protein
MPEYWIDGIIYFEDGTQRKMTNEELKQYNKEMNEIRLKSR